MKDIKGTATKFLVIILSVLIACHTGYFTARGSVVSDIRSAYGLGDNISIQYDVKNEKGALALCVTGAKNDLSVLMTHSDRSYIYRIKPSEKAELPLNMGDGQYNIDVLIYATPTAGENIWQKTIEVQLENQFTPYLNPSKIVNWSQDMPLVADAKRLTKDLNDKEAALAICAFIANRYSYEQNFDPPDGYVPNLNEVYESESVICYDLATIYAAMCRSTGIPCKLVMGYSEYLGVEKYHAWCKVFLDGKWHMVDPTYSLEKGSVFLDPSKTIETKNY